MSDNFSLSTPGGTVTIAADEVSSGIYNQRVKIQHGADGSATDVSSASPLPVYLPSATGSAVKAVLATDGVVYSTTIATQSFHALSETGSDQAVISAQGANNKIRIVGGLLACDGASGSTLLWKSATTAITGAFPMVQYQPVPLPFNPLGHFQTAANEALNVTVSAGNLLGYLIYVVVQ